MVWIINSSLALSYLLPRLSSSCSLLALVEFAKSLNRFFFQITYDNAKPVGMRMVVLRILMDRRLFQDIIKERMTRVN
jgi:hypothetical protein